MGDQVDDLVADLFGDFSDEEGTPGAGAAQTSAKRPGEAPAGDAAEGSSQDGQPDAARSRKRRRTGDASKFFETEAVEAGAGEDEDGSDLEDLIDDAAPDIPQDKARQKAELDQLQAEMDARDAAGTAMRRSGFLDRLEERFSDQHDAKDEGIAIADLGRSVPSSDARKAKSSHQTVFTVPDPARDPRLWCCKTFAPERDLCISLLLKAGIELSAGRTPPVYSVFYNPSLRGYIYIEAHKENDIREFSKGIRGISPWQIRLVPVAQMAQVFSSAVLEADKKEVLRVGDWVRLKKGTYGYDLAKIEEIQDQEYTVKLKPRLDYSGNVEKQNKALLGGRSREDQRTDREAKKRPAARWFNRADVEAAQLVISSERERRYTSKGFLCFFMVDNEVYRDGFLFKKFKAHMFITGEAVRPTEHELQDWANAPTPGPMTTPEIDLKRKKPEDEELDRKLMPPPSLLPQKASVQQKLALDVGDIVIVIHGDLMNLRGVVTKAFPGLPTVEIRPYPDMGVKEELLTVAVDRLSKYFEVGDHIKAYAGEHRGQSGYIVKVQLLPQQPKWGFGATARCITLVGPEANEWTVLLNHARISVEMGQSDTQVGEFKIADIVKYGQDVCIIVKLHGKKATLLDCHNETRVASCGELQPIAVSGLKGAGKSRGIRHFWAQDRRGNRVTVGAHVLARHRSVPRGVKAEVIWIYNHNLFLRAEDLLVGERAFMVVPSAHCEFCWTKEQDVDANIKQYKKEKEEMELALSQENADNPFGTNVQMASTLDWTKSWFKKLMGQTKPGRGASANMPYTEGECVRITKGSYKGLRAEVRDYVGEKVRLSLLAKPKLVLVDLVYVTKDDYNNRGEKRWLQDKDPKVVRMSNAGEDYISAPMTPQAPDAPIIIPPSPGSDSDANILAIAAGTSEKAQGSSAELLANDQKEWDPSFGMEPTSAPATPTNGTETAPSGGDQALSSWSKMMGDEDEMMGAHEDDSDDAWGSWGASTTSAVPAEKGAGKKDRSTPLRSTGATPDDSLGGSEAEDEDPFQWLSLGAGVLYKEGGDEKQGWVFKVSPDDDDGGSVLVVPNEHCPRAGTVPLSEMKKLSLMNNELKPASLFVKGDTVAVIRGRSTLALQ
jgi:transcription elongation factor SPT5